MKAYELAFALAGLAVSGVACDSERPAASADPDAGSPAEQQTGATDGQRDDWNDQRHRAAQGRDGIKVADSWITTNIYNALAFESGIDAREVEIDTRKGVVTLVGTVRSEWERQRILLKAASIAGVTEIIDKLQVVNGRTPRPQPDGVIRTA